MAWAWLRGILGTGFEQKLHQATVDQATKEKEKEGEGTEASAVQLRQTRAWQAQHPEQTKGKQTVGERSESVGQRL